MPSLAKLGGIIRKLRTDKGMSLTAFARAIDMDKGDLSKLERGLSEEVGFPSFGRIAEMASQLQVDAVVLCSAAELVPPPLSEHIGTNPELIQWLESMRRAGFDDDDYSKLHDAMESRGLLEAEDATFADADIDLDELD